MKITAWFIFFLGLLSVSEVKAQSVMIADTFSYTINLDLSKNSYLKTIPVDLLKGYCKGYWNAYYPKREFNQCLFDDFLERFSYSQMSMQTNVEYCYEDYCNDRYFTDWYDRFTRKMRYKEVVYYNSAHSVVRREVIWLQIYYSEEGYNGWNHYNGPVFWLSEIRKSEDPVKVYNPNIRSVAWSLEKEFMYPGFITNENKQQEQQQKLEHYDRLEEH
jgi:hypothetical protein